MSESETILDPRVYPTVEPVHIPGHPGFVRAPERGSDEEPERGAMIETTAPSSEDAPPAAPHPSRSQVGAMAVSADFGTPAVTQDDPPEDEGDKSTKPGTKG